MSDKKKTLPDAYHICFDTKQFPGLLVATRITIQQEVIRNEERQMNIALAAHPLYKDLFDYCMNNPPPGVKVNRRR